jgi:hypothetical protein
MRTASRPSPAPRAAGAGMDFEVAIIGVGPPDNRLDLACGLRAAEIRLRDDASPRHAEPISSTASSTSRSIRRLSIARSRRSGHNWDAPRPDRPTAWGLRLGAQFGVAPAGRPLSKMPLSSANDFDVVDNRLNLSAMHLSSQNQLTRSPLVPLAEVAGSARAVTPCTIWSAGADAPYPAGFGPACSPRSPVRQPPAGSLVSG